MVEPLIGRHGGRCPPWFGRVEKRISKTVAAKSACKKTRSHTLHWKRQLPNPVQYALVSTIPFSLAIHSSYDYMPPTTLPNLNNLRMAMRLKTLLILITTGFWYFSSSINAVASQKLFQGFQSAPTGYAIVTNNVILLSIVLTFLQLGTASARGLF